MYPVNNQLTDELEKLHKLRQKQYQRQVEDYTLLKVLEELTGISINDLRKYIVFIQTTNAPITLKNISKQLNVSDYKARELKPVLIETLT